MSGHRPAATQVGGRYPWLSTCSCGWRYGAGYLTEEAARNVADDHAASAQEAERIAS